MGLRPIRDLLRYEPQSRAFFAAHAQSSLGTGAGYVALLVLAYERLESPWAISLVLLADFLPSMFLGPIFGAAADRWSRRWCAALADVARALAFVSLAFFDGFGITLALALLAGVGTGLFRPAVMAGLPSLVSPAGCPRRPRCTARSPTSASPSGRARGRRAAAGERGDRDARERDQLRRLRRRAHARCRSAAATGARSHDRSCARRARAFAPSRGCPVCAR